MTVPGTIPYGTRKTCFLDVFEPANHSGTYFHETNFFKNFSPSLRRTKGGTLRCPVEGYLPDTNGIPTAIMRLMTRRALWDTRQSTEFVNFCCGVLVDFCDLGLNCP